MASATGGEVVTLAPGQSLSDALSNLFESAHANPVAKLGGPYIAQTGTAINFNAADSFDASATIISYKWDFDGNGTVDRTTTTPTTSFAYASTFHGIASVEVVADDGRSALATTDVTVDSVGLAPVQPIAVTSASAAVTGASQVTVSWTAAANDHADGYKIYRTNGVPARFTTTADPHSAVIDGLDLSQPIQLYVVAANGYGESAATATPPVGGLTPGWTPSSIIDAQSSASTPDLVLGPGGAGYAIWSGGDAHIWFAKWDPSNGWGTNVRPSPASANGQGSPTIGVDSAGSAYAVWQESISSTNRDIYFSKRAATTGIWGTPTRVSNDSGTADQTDAQIAVLPDGSAIAVWVDRRSAQWNVYSARLAAGATVWGTNLKVTSNTVADKANPRVVLAADGTAFAVWGDKRNGNFDIDYATLTPNGTTWSTNAKISDDPGTAVQSLPRIAIDGAGSLTAAWLDARTGSQVRVTTRPAGSGTWSTSTPVTDSASVPLHFDMVVRSDGRAAVAWADNRGITDLYGTQKLSPTQTWQPPSLWSDTPSGNLDYNPALAIDTQNLFVVWNHMNKLVVGASPGHIHARYNRL